MSADVIVEEVTAKLTQRFGEPRQSGRARIVRFGNTLTCSISYSKQLGGHKYFYAVPAPILDASRTFPSTKFGEFVLLICGSAERVLVLPRKLVLDMLRDVPSRRVDIFVESDTYVMQTTQHPKLDVTEYLNAYPKAQKGTDGASPTEEESTRPARQHIKVQWQLIQMGRAEGCTVWVPTNDRNFAFKKSSFSTLTLSKLPNFGFDQITRRIVENIDVLWLKKNTIRKAFEIECTTSIYSGLLRMNDLVLAQPNSRIALYLAATQSKRQKVLNQLIRPSFQRLLPACRFISLEEVDEQFGRLQSVAGHSGTRVSGLLKGEKFTLPEHCVYPPDVR